MTKPKDMTLDEFLKIQQEELVAFEKFWRKHNKKDPENFPMSFPADDAGGWWEQFHIFYEEEGIE